MANDSIDQAAIDIFEKNIRSVVQQERSMLASTVTPYSGPVGSGRRFTIQNSLAFAARGARNPNVTRTPTNEGEYNFRWLTTAAYDLSAQWDRRDEWLLADMQNPKSPLVKDMARAWARLEDDVIIASMNGTVTTEEDKSGTSTFPAGQQVGVQFGESPAANSGLTLKKLQEVNRRFLANNVSPGATKFFVIGPEEVVNLQNIAEYRTLDSNAQRGLMTGQPTPFLGFTFIVSTRLVTVANVRKCFAYCADGIQFAPAIMEVRYDELPAYRYDRQLYAFAELGAMRLYDEFVIEVATDITA